MWKLAKNPPSTIGSYLVFLSDCYVCMAFFNSDGKWCEMWQQKFLDVKYWMPLPAAPTADNVEGANLQPTTALAQNGEGKE